MTGIWFAAGLSVGKSLEASHGSGRTAVIQANERLDRAFFIVPVGIAGATMLLLSTAYSLENIRNRPWRFAVDFVSLFVALALLDYLIGVVAFEKPGLQLIRYLGR